jgi:toxin ParE1/3/4
VKLRLTDFADSDIADALSDSYSMFGERQTKRYSEIIKLGFTQLAAEPLRPASKPRPQLGRGVRSFHLQFAAGRMAGPAT